GAGEHLLDRRDHSARLILRSARHLGRVQPLSVEQRGVGEGPTDVDAEQHGATLYPARPGGRPPPAMASSAARSAGARTIVRSQACSWALAVSEAPAGEAGIGKDTIAHRSNGPSRPGQVASGSRAG